MSTAISHLTDFCSGRLKQRTLLLIFIPLILASYFGSLTFAISMFPGPFVTNFNVPSQAVHVKITAIEGPIVFLIRALSVDSQPAAPRPYVTLTCLRGFGRLDGGAK
jgi:hypothetical protein